MFVIIDVLLLRMRIKGNMGSCGGWRGSCSKGFAQGGAK